MNRIWLANNKVLVSIFLFVSFYFLMYQMKPRFFFHTDGSLREFGVGYKNKTILPVWLFSLLLGILCYIGVLYYIAFPKFMRGGGRGGYDYFGL